MLLTSASDWKPQPLDWLIPGLLCDSLTVISGEPKMGKTLFAANLARSLINQTEVLNQQPKQGNFRVAWMGFDMGWQQEFTNEFSDLTANGPRPTKPLYPFIAIVLRVLGNICRCESFNNCGSTPPEAGMP